MPVFETANKRVVLENASGTEIGTAAAPVRVDPTGTTTQPVSSPSPLRTEFGGTSTAVVAAAAATTVIKGSAGRLCRVLVTTAGTAVLTFFDNASATTGTVIGLVPSTATLGAIFEFQIPAANGITAGGGAGSPAVTVSFL